MENIFLVKIQKNINQRKHIHNITFCQKFLTQLESRILTMKIGVIFYIQEPFFLYQAEQVLIFLGI